MAVNAPVKPKTRFGKRTWHIHSPPAAGVFVLIFISLSPGVFQLSGQFPKFVPPPGKIGYANSLYGSLDSAEACLVRSGPDRPFRLVTDPANDAEFDAACQKRPGDVMLARCESTVAERGFWNATRVEGDRRIVLEGRVIGRATPPTDPSKWRRFTFTPEELAQARSVYFAYINDIDAEFAKDLDKGGVHVRYPLLKGWFLDAGAVIALSAFFFSVSGMRRYMSVAKADHRLRRGQCGMCKYDLSGTPAGPEGMRCPECGAAWDNSWTIRRRSGDSRP